MRMSIKEITYKICPRFMRGAALKAYRSSRELGYKTESILFPRKMTGYCPCCGIRFKSFISRDYVNRPERFNPLRYEGMEQNVHCPNCKSMPRHRILAMWCRKHKDYLRKADILYFAPENSMMIWMKKNGVSCTTADLYNEADIKLDIQETGLPDESYDVVVCNHVLEHVDDFRKALRELYRILRKGGSLICSFPMDPNVELLEEDPSVTTEADRIRLYGQNDHKRVFGMKADQFLREVGFTVKKISGDKCPDVILPIVGPADYDINVLFRCVK